MINMRNTMATSTKKSVKVLVTGGAGFIGSHLVDKLIEIGGFDVTVIDNLSVGRKEWVNPKARFIKQDLSFIYLKGNYDVVVHLAAQTDVRYSMINPEIDLKQNVSASFNLLKYIKAKRFIFISSGGAIYGNSNKRNREDDQLNPISFYGIHKLTFEYYLKSLHKNYCILRLGNVYGDKRNNKGIIYLLKNKKIVTIFGDGEQRRDYIHVDDVVEAIIKSINSDEIGEFNIATGISTSINRLVKILNAKVIYTKEKQGEIKNSCLNISRAKRLLNWQPKIKISSLSLTKTNE